VPIAWGLTDQWPLEQFDLPPEVLDKTGRERESAGCRKRGISQLRRLAESTGLDFLDASGNIWRDVDRFSRR
jgi:hypothetical protein